MARRMMKLLLKTLLIACFHVGILFIAYGRRWLAYLPHMLGMASFAWLVLPTCVAFCLYYFSFSASGFLSAPNRRAKLMTCSIVVSLLSLYLGVFLSLNTYGE